MIRDAVAGDGRAIAEIHVGSWRSAYAGLLPDDVLTALDVDARARVWEERLACPPLERHRLIVLDEDGVGGFASTGPPRDADADEWVGELYVLCLTPVFWDRGPGRALHDAAVEGLRDDGYEEATLWVLEADERARRFYERAGWEVDGTSKGERVGPSRTPVLEVRYRLGLTNPIR